MTPPERRGILLAGGTGSRLYPATLAISKQLLPVYDKPMIYYPLSTLMLGGLRDILIITTPHDAPLFERLLGDGRSFGIRLSYATQPHPGGIAQALVIAEDYLRGAAATLILGDNLFYGAQLAKRLRHAQQRAGATVFAYPVSDPERYGVVSFSADSKALSLEEKPALPASEWAVTGLYVYGPEAPELARTLQPSARGEVEITDLNRLYLARGELSVERLGRGFAWLDAGTHDSLLEASSFVQTLERRQGLKLAAPEEIAWQQGWLSTSELLARAQALAPSSYARFLQRLPETEGAF